MPYFSCVTSKKNLGLLLNISKRFQRLQKNWYVGILVQFSLCNVNVIQYVYGYLLKYTPIFRFGQCRHILFRVLDKHRPGGLNPTWWSIPILHIYQNESHTFLFNSECVITLPVYLSKHKWETLPLTIKGHDFVKCYISLFCT